MPAYISLVYFSLLSLLFTVTTSEASTRTPNFTIPDQEGTVGRRLKQSPYEFSLTPFSDNFNFPTISTPFSPVTPYFADGQNSDLIPRDVVGPSFDNFPYRQPSQKKPVRLPVGAYPTPKGGNQDWDIIVTGRLTEKASRVWDSIKDPRRALAVAYRQFAYEVSRTGRTIDVTLNSGQEMMYTIEDTNQSGRYHHFVLFGHSRKIFSIAPTFVNIRRSQLFILVKESAGGTEIVIGLQLQANPPKTRQRVQFFMQSFLTQLVDHFQMEFGVGDCNETPLHREILGICNNPYYPTQGASETPLKRLRKYDPVYIDNDRTPAYNNVSPRHISNIVCSQETDEDNAWNKLNITDSFVFFGQFIDHDIGITAIGSFTEGEQPLFSYGHSKFKERFDIVVPKNDPDFTGPYRKERLPFDRSVYVREDGKPVTPRIQPNSITSYLDLSQVYGADRVRAKALRAFIGGKLRTSGKGRGFLPFNGPGKGGVNINLENAPDSDSKLYVAGDIRVLENPVLASLHALFLLEHNKVADELALAFKALGKVLTDEELFQYARDICIAEYQSIVFNEWLPVLLGRGVVSAEAYSYDYRVDASLDVFFSTVSFRFGHSMVNNVLWKRELNGAVNQVRLHDVFFNPAAVDEHSFSKYLLGAVGHEAREMDEKIVDGLRSKLFTKTGGASADLVALNIQRGRDHGLPSYNKARMAYGLPPAESFSDITTDTILQNKLMQAYKNNIHLVDAFIGGLAEERPEGRLFGDLFHTSLKDQFTRLRDGDRFFYKRFPFGQELLAAYPRLREILSDKVSLFDVIYRNTDISRSTIYTLHGSRSTAFVL